MCETLRLGSSYSGQCSSSWDALENICKDGLKSHHILWESCEFKMMHEVTEVLLLLLKGYECVQTLFFAYVTMSENIN